MYDMLLLTYHCLGLDELRAQLRKDYHSTPINRLCPRIDPNPNLRPECCFTSAAPIITIIVKFDMIAGRLQSELFAKIWQDTLKKAARSIPELTIQHIVTEMWNPTIAACGALLESIHGHTIKLSTVDTYFKAHGESKERIVVHLYNLYNGVQFCHDKPPVQPCPKWITTTVDLMQQYWTLQQNAKAASTVLDLKEKLNLTGDFSLIETLAHKVIVIMHVEFLSVFLYNVCFQMSTSMRDQTLAAVDAKLIDAGEFLKELSADKRLKCLQTFASCMDIVNWIRKETEGQNIEFQHVLAFNIIITCICRGESFAQFRQSGIAYGSRRRRFCQ